MTQPAGKKLKTADIAEITGLSEEQICDIANRHGNRIPSQKVGRIQVYDKKAADMFATIAETEGSEPAKPPMMGKGKAEPVKKDQDKTGGLSRLSDISKTREEEKKTTAAPSRSSMGSVPNHLVNTVAMQGQQFSRFADRLTTLEDAVHADREALGERIDRLERQVAALQEQMEVVGSWIEYVDRRLDADSACLKQLAEETHTWTEYVRTELAFLRLSWWKRRQHK